MSLSQNELDQIKEVIAHQLNGALDAKLEPIKEEIRKIREEDFQQVHDSLSKIQKDVEANASNISAMQGDI